MQRQAAGNVSGVRQHRRLWGWWRGSWMDRAQQEDSRSATAAGLGGRSEGAGADTGGRAYVAGEGRGPPAGRRGGVRGGGGATFGKTERTGASWPAVA